jgi:hypothetical protein
MLTTQWGRVHWKYKAVTGLMVFLVAVFLWLLWMIGEAGWNQVAPR